MKASPKGYAPKARCPRPSTKPMRRIARSRASAVGSFFHFSLCACHAPITPASLFLLFFDRIFRMILCRPFVFSSLLLFYKRRGEREGEACRSDAVNFRREKEKSGAPPRKEAVHRGRGRLLRYFNGAACIFCAQKTRDRSIGTIYCTRDNALWFSGAR